MAGLLCAIIMLLPALAGCSAPKTVKAAVKITSATAEVVLEKTVDVTGSNPTAKDAIVEACKAGDVYYTLANGMFDNFNHEASTKTDGWLLYVNDKLADVGAESYTLQEGDKVEFRYVNYDEAFAS